MTEPGLYFLCPKNHLQKIFVIDYGCDPDHHYFSEFRVAYNLSNFDNTPSLFPCKQCRPPPTPPSLLPLQVAPDSTPLLSPP